MSIPFPADEEQRLQKLLDYAILDTPSETAYDDLTLLAAHICKAPIALISLLDTNRQWFKSAIGLDIAETSRNLAFCAYAILDRTTMVVPDAAADARFCQNPLVTSDPHIRFYAGAPLRSPDGYALGTLCVIDTQPRQLAADQIAALEALSRRVVSQLELRLSQQRLAQTVEDYHRINVALSQSQQQIREQQRLYETILHALPQAVFWKDCQSVFLGCNRNFARDVGLTLVDDILGKTDQQLGCSAEEVERYRTRDRHILESGEPMLHCVEPRHQPTGEITWLESSRVPLRNGDGQIIGIVGIYEDVTERLQMQEQLNQRIAAVEAAMDGIAILPDGEHYSYLNQAHLEMFGYEHADELVGKSWRVLYREEEQHDIDYEITVTLQERGYWRGAPLSKRRDGSLFYAEVTLTLSGAGLVCVCRDITERIQAEEALRQSEAQKRAILSAIPDMMLLVDIDGVYREVVKSGKVVDPNNAYPDAAQATKVVDLCPDIPDRVGHRLIDLLPPEVALREMEAIHQAVTTGEMQIHEQQITINNCLYWEEVRVVPYDRQVAMLMIRNISDRKAMEVQLKASQQRLSLLVEQTPVAIVEWDLKQRITAWNPAAEHIFGYTAAETLGRTLDFMLPHACLEGVKGVIAELLQQKRPNQYVNENLTKDRGIITCAWYNTPLITPDGKLIGAASMALDITERRQAEVKLRQSLEREQAIATQQAQLYEQLRQQTAELERAKDAAEAANRAKSEFLATMSHEIRTPMNAVIGMTELLLGTCLSAQQQDFVETIRQSGDALLLIINDILDFSKIESGRLELEMRPFHLRNCIEEAIDFLAPKAEAKSIDLVYRLTAQVPRTVSGDITRLRQILINLLSNAVKFTEMGQVVISVMPFPCSEEMSCPCPNSAPACELLFHVQDTGIGIPVDRMGRLFQSFSQVDASVTRKFGGTGLGLAICQRLAATMGGRIWVESSGVIGGDPPPGWSLRHPASRQGASFYFTVQVTEHASPFPDANGFTPPPTQVSTPPQPAPPATGTPIQPPQLDGIMAERFPLRILIAEDNSINSKLVLLLLQRLGYQADAVSNGQEVLDTLCRQSYDVVLMDVQMPVMDGLTATRQIQQTWQAGDRPHIIAVTANATEGDRQQCFQAGADDYVSKPIRIDALVAALKRCPLQRFSTNR
ncbi:MAG: PAS domain S-box protein [Elainellaceae cyanobacterium]